MARAIIVGLDPKSDDRAAVRLGVQVARFTHAPLIVASVQSGPRPLALTAEQTLPYAIGTMHADLIDLDLEFLLFVHERTGEDVVVHRRDDGRIGLLYPPGSPLADEDEPVVPEPSRYPEPIPLDQARDEMDVLEHRFLYFVDRADKRGKVLYLRHQGDYGLVIPPSPSAAAAG